MNVILIGMKHCGKSTLGAALAARWGCRFHDVDRLMEEQHACATGQRLSVREIFATRGEAAFGELEADVVAALYLALTGATDAHVVALGGRTVLNERIGALLSGLGTIVYLAVSPEEMFARVLKGGLPPFLDKEDPVMQFLELYKERVPYYEKFADLTVHLDGLDIMAATEKLCRALETYQTKPERPR